MLICLRLGYSNFKIQSLSYRVYCPGVQRYRAIDEMIIYDMVLRSLLSKKSDFSVSQTETRVSLRSRKLFVSRAVMYPITGISADRLP